MKKLSLMTLVVILSACKSDQLDGEAIHARVSMAPGVSATCVLFEVRDPSSHSVLDKRWLERKDDDLQIAVFRGALPETVELAARPFRDGTCQGGAEAKTPNGVFKTVTATFVKGAVPPVTEIQLEPGTDGDTDGYVSTDSGGADCRDGDQTVNPAAAETCSVQVDLNCDGRKACEASNCLPTDCKGPAATLVMGVSASSVTAGACSSGSVSVRDANGTDTRVSGSTTVNLTTPSGGAAFFSDAACTMPASSVTLTGNEDSVSFFFQGQVAGTVTLRAAATGLTTVNQSVQVLPGTGNKLVILSTPRTAAASTCSQAVQFQSQDALSNPAQVSSATQVTLQSSATGFTFYSDSSCNTPATSSVTLTAGTSTGSFYFKGTQAGPVNVTLTATNFTGVQQTQTIIAGPPAFMVFTGPASVAAGECSGLVTVTLQDRDGNVANATGATNISLTPNGGPLTFFTSPTCAAPATTTVSIASGASSATFRYRSNQAGTFSIGGSFGTLTSTPLSVTVNPGPPSVLVFSLSTPPQTRTAGICSGIVTVEQRDSFGNPVSATSPMPVTLTSNANPPSSFQFFTEAGCTGSAVSSTTVAAGSSTASFYFKGTVAGTVSMTATQGSISMSQNATIIPAAPTRLAFSQPSMTVAAGDCTAVTLFSTDDFGNRSNVSGNQAITLTPGANMTFSTANNCSTSAGTVTITGGQSSVSFFVRATLVGSVSGTASRTGFTPGMLNLTVNPGVPTRLAFTTPEQTVEVNRCSAITTVQVRDSSNNASPVSTATTVNLTPSPSGNISFYLNADCTGPTTTSITIASGQSSGSFYFKDTTAENVTITASNASLTSANQDQTITPLQPTALVFTSSPQTRTAGTCSGLVTVQAQAQGSPTTVTSATLIDLSATPSAGFTFYASGNCSGPPTSQVTIGTGQSTVSFTFRGNTAGTIALTASNPSIATPATQNATITPAAASKLVFTTAAHTTVAGVCSQAVTVQSRDNSDNISAVTTDKTLTLGQNGTPADPNFHFYSDAACNNEVTGGSPLILAAGQSAVTFYYKGQRARAVDLTVAASGLTTTPSQPHTITAAAASKVVFSLSTPAQTLLASTCAARTIERQDAFSNPVMGGSTLDVALTASASAEFFLDSGCTTATDSVTIAAGSSTADFWFKGLSGGNNATAPLTLMAAPSGLTAASQLETIIPTVRTGSCNIPSSAKSTICTITPALGNVSKAFLVFQATTQNQPGAQANGRCVLSSVSQITCERGANGSSPLNIRWSVAELPSGVTVQSPAVTCTDPTATVSFSAVTQDQTFLLMSSERNMNDQSKDVPRLAELKTTTQAEVRKIAGTGCNSGDTTHLQVVGYAGTTVQRGLTSIGTLAASVEVNLSPAVPLNRSVVLYSYVFDSTTTNICDRLVRGELTNGGNRLTFSRGNGDASISCTLPQINTISYEVVTFPEGTVVQQVTRALTATTASTNVTISPVDPSRTIVIGGGQWASGQVHGEARNSANENISEGRALAFLADGSTLTLSRETAADSATFTVYVVQLKP